MLESIHFPKRNINVWNKLSTECAHATSVNSLRPGPLWDIFGTLQITKYFAHNNANAPYVSYIKMKDTKQGF